MNERTEFEQLLSNLLDGSNDALQSDRLCTLLADHPEFQGEYLECMKLHALLQWRAGRTAPASIADDHAAIPSTVAPPSVPSPRKASRWNAWRLSAAVTFFAVAIAFAVIVTQPASQASTDVVDRLVDWNVELTRAETSKDRDRIYQDQAEAIRETLASAKLATEDRALAQKLFENGIWLKQSNDPVAEFDRMNQLADHFVARLDVATQAQDGTKAAKLADALERFEVGIDATFERAVTCEISSKEGKKKFEHAKLGGAIRMKKLETILTNNPSPPRKAIHRIMKGGHKKKHHRIGN